MPLQYYRLVRFFPGGRVLMVTTAEEPSAAVKLLNSRNNCAIQGCMFGHYRTVNNRVICIVQKTKNSSNNVSSNRRMSLRQRKAQQKYVFEVPDQDFHFVSYHLFSSFHYLLRFQVLDFLQFSFQLSIYLSIITFSKNWKKTLMKSTLPFSSAIDI